MRVPSTVREPLRQMLLERQEARSPFSRAKPASVLVPLVARDGEAWVWLIKRSEAMTAHRGQVAFPGGKPDPDDPSPLHTALRETHEELGFPTDAIEIDGRLDDVPTTTGFVITPFVGWLRDDLVPTPNEHEIARVFCVPLAAFVGREPRPQLFRGKGLTRIVPSWPIPGEDGEYVWGATGRILKQLVGIVRDASRRHRFAG